MMRALWSAASGMKAQQTNVDTISNNIANVNTVGYKLERAEFKSLLYQTLQNETTTANGENKPVSAQVGLGTRVASMNSIFTQGELIASEDSSDFAVVGDGFFGVRGEDGQTYYTRNGDFVWAMGNTGITLCTTNGNPVLDSTGNTIVLPEGVQSEAVIVGSDGSIGYLNATGEYVNLNKSIGVWQFSNPSGLEKMANSLMAATNASGAPLNEATQAGLRKSSIYQNYLEGSNVQVADEMVNLIIAQRAYELNSKAIQAADSMLGQANNLRS